jgi:hypothetical protein
MGFCELPTKVGLDPPCLSFPDRQDYRCEPQAPSLDISFKKICRLKKNLKFKMFQSLKLLGYNMTPEGEKFHTLCEVKMQVH